MMKIFKKFFMIHPLKTTSIMHKSYKKATVIVKKNQG